MDKVDNGIDQGERGQEEPHDRLSIAENQQSKDADFPDGGAQAWTVVLGCWCGMFCTFGLVNCSGAFEAYYTGDNGPLNHYSQGLVSWILSFQAWGIPFGGIMFGPFFDHFGPKWLLTLGSIVYVFGLMMMSISDQYYQIFLSQGIVAAFGSSAVFSGCVSSVTTWFKHRRGYAFGVMVSGSSLGGVIMPIMMNRLIPLVGFPWTMRIIAFMILGLLLVTMWTARSRLPPKPRPFNLASYVSGLRSPAFSLTCTASFFFYWALFIPFNYIILQAEQAGVSSQLAQYLLPIINAVSIPGRILPGILADKAGRFNVTIVVASINAILCLALWIPGSSQGAIIAFAVLYGLFSGSLISLAPTLVAQISDISEIGTRQGTCLFFQSLGALTGSPIAGAIIKQQNGSYVGLQVFCGVSFVASMAVYIVARTSLVGLKATKV
ncbi:major facilitator superfamily domain-containing protein [Aspergillus pseudocaelatus]|uniref:Major facilitator superfamily domain-containing protein n=1 Tax=Aspergillus pseudocaelatus TaxID=1825620 RepID=A0ABQ6X2X2_9EURO|nr:major facilitator superfamily domain-containing protein [Aspergillus pseudocaelatus]